MYPIRTLNIFLGIYMNQYNIEAHVPVLYGFDLSDNKEF